MTTHSEPVNLILGSDSIIGRALWANLKEAGKRVIGTTRRREKLDKEYIYLDLLENVKDWRCPSPVDVAFVCAGVTKIEECKQNPVMSRRINVEGITTLIKNLVKEGAFVIYLSTNQVFDGSKAQRPPDDPVSPITEYGRQKAKVEQEISRWGDSVAIARLTKVLGPDVMPFSEWNALLKRGNIIHPFSDMFLAPISLSYAISVLRYVASRHLSGVTQVSGSYDVSYADAAYRGAKLMGMDQQLVQPIRTSQSGFYTESPLANTTLNIDRLKSEFRIGPPDVWWTIEKMFTEPGTLIGVQKPDIGRKKKENLAIYGGKKVREKPMPARMAFQEYGQEVVKKAFDYYKTIGLDPGYESWYEKLYTKAFVEYMGVDGFADGVNSGTAALFIALASLQLMPRSQVIVSPVTDPGMISAVILNRLVPVLADSSFNSFNIGVDEFKRRLTPETKAVVVAHIAGKAAPIDEICEVAREKGLYIIEDCSQAHGARLNGRKVGTFGDIACFSTMYRKVHATGGCGGVLFTQNKKFYNLIRSYADRGKPFFEDGYDEKDPGSFLFPALNLNIDELSCAIGIKSLERLEDTRLRRIAFLKRLGKEISKYSKVCRLVEVSDNDSPFFHTVLVDTAKIACSKVGFAKAVEAEGIDINTDYKYVVCEWNWARPYLSDDFKCPNAIRHRDSSFNLRFNENYGKEEIKDIVNAILKVERIYKR